ncbi:MAG TPA: hypothetical protein PKV16_00245 [Caldisericia bacterium]|nr:hypothetical protein [Caldisericia bacterium]HPF49157.1 hypothetical protein [Caldisericia bacterium]HPI82979.1 hypothetical protein [Caldisericia bacterium]HPQ92206.1 hypothetical protein [Caldisericia bacterium]HRV74696.1 hypothetical protein [Caldisericia bacterium]
MRKQTRLALAWLIIGLGGAAVAALLGILVNLTTIMPFGSYIVLLLISLGFLPGLFGAFSQRVLGLITLVAIPFSIVWGIVHIMLGYHDIWQYVLVLDFIRIFSIGVIIGCLLQMILPTKPVKNGTDTVKGRIETRNAIHPEAVKTRKEAKYYEV